MPLFNNCVLCLLVVQDCWVMPFHCLGNVDTTKIVNYLRILRSKKTKKSAIGVR